MSDKEFTLRTVEPANPITFIEEKCTGCSRCVDACPIEILLPAEKTGNVPLVAYPDECWYCGCCVMECPGKAIIFRHPLMNQARWVDKKSLIDKEED